MAAAVEARARRRVARASLLDFSLAAAFEGSDGGEPGGGGGWSSMDFVDDGTRTPGIVGGRPPGLGAAGAGARVVAAAAASCACQSPNNFA